MSGTEILSAGSFHAVKFLADGSSRRVDGEATNRKYGELAKLLELGPIGEDEALLIDLGEGVNPLSVLPWVSFSGTTSVVFEDYEEFAWAEEWPSSEIYFNNEQFARFAMVRQGSTSWYVVGLHTSDGMRLVLASEEDYFYPGSRYLSDRVLADFSYHSDGPGPVSWDLSKALLEVDGYWVVAQGGDNYSGDTVEAAPEAWASQYFNWLQSSNSLLMFILTKAHCLWSDETLREKFRSAIADTSHFIWISAALTDKEVEEILSLVRHSELPEAKILAILEQDSGATQGRLIRALKKAGSAENPESLIFADALSRVLGI